MYVAVALAVALVLRRGDVAGVMLGIVVGVTLICTYALATRLFQDRFDTYDDRIDAYRLAAPLGYWNSLGLLASIGIIAALDSSPTRGARLPPSWPPAWFRSQPRRCTSRSHVGHGLLLRSASRRRLRLDPRRLRFLWTSFAVAVPSAACLAYASTFASLTEPGSVPAAASRDGHRVAVVVGGAVAGAVLAGMLARLVARRVPLSARLRTRSNAALAAAVAVLVAGSLVAIGGPAAAVDGLQRSIRRRGERGIRSERSAVQHLGQRQGGAAPGRLGCGSGPTRSRQWLGHVRVPLVRAATESTSSCVTATPSTWRRSRSSASSASRFSCPRSVLPARRSAPCASRAVSSRVRSVRSSPGAPLRASTGTGRWWR